MTDKPPPTMPQNTPPMESQQQPPPVYAEGPFPPGVIPSPFSTEGATTVDGAPPQGWVPQPPQQQQQGYIPPGGYPAPQIISAVPGNVYPQAILGMKVLPPKPNPLPGQVLIGWEVVKPEKGCCKCEGLSNNAWLIIILLAIVFWPLCWVPCVMDECFETCQRPVYGFPQGTPPPQMGVPMPPPGTSTPPQAASMADAAASKV